VVNLRTTLGALGLLLAVSSAAFAAGPGVRCEAEQIGRRTLAHVDLLHFFDRELLRLIRLGLEGRGHVSFALVHRSVLHEERGLAQRFGREFTEYRTQVPRYVGLPGRGT